MVDVTVRYGSGGPERVEVGSVEVLVADGVVPSPREVADAFRRAAAWLESEGL